MCNFKILKSSKMETEKFNELIDNYVKNIRNKFNQQIFTKSYSQLNDYDWATKELLRAEKKLKTLYPISIFSVILMVVAVLLNQFEIITRVNNNGLITFILCTIGFYFSLERLKIQIERLKNILFLHQLKNK
jgi:hypothetical protein